MNRLEDRFKWLRLGIHQFVSEQHDADKVIAFEKGDLLFVFNFHPTKSYEHYRIGTKWPEEHAIVLDTDQPEFGGHNRLEYGRTNWFPFIRDDWRGRPNYVQLYLPARTATVLAAKSIF